MANEARLNELLDIYEQALSENDTATAEKAKAAIQAERNPAGSARTAYRTPGAPADGPQASGFTDPRALLVGLTRVPSGVVQAGAGLVEATTGANAVRPTTEAINAIERKIMGGEPLTPEEEQIAKITNIAAGVMIPGAAAAKAVGAVRPVTFAKGVGTAAGVGAVAGATNFDPNAQGAADVLVGPTLGAVTGGLFGLAPATYGLAKNILFKPFQEGPVAQAQQRIAEMAASPRTRNVSLTRAQETGRYEAEVAEARVAGTKAKEFYAKQQEELGSILDTWAAREANGPPISGLGVDIQEALGRARAAVQKVASARYGAQLDEAKRLASEDVADAVGLRVDNLSQFVQDKLSAEDFSQWSKLIDPLSRKEAGRVWELFQKISSQNGTLGMADMIELHRASNKFRKALEKARDGGKLSDEAWAANRMGEQLADAVESDVDTMTAKLAEIRQQNPQWAASGVGKKYEQAWAKFEEARNDYKTYVKYRRDMDASVVSQLFARTPNDPAKAMDMLLRAEPKEQELAVRALLTHSPETLRDLKAYHLRTVQNQMRQQTAEGGASSVTPEAMIKALTEDGRLVGSGFWSADDAKDLAGIVAYARMIQNKAPVRAQTLDPESATMALISRSSAFLARIGHRILTQGKLEDFFFDPANREALKIVATTNSPISAKYQAAVGKLMEVMAEE